MRRLAREAQGKVLCAMPERRTNAFPNILWPLLVTVAGFILAVFCNAASARADTSFSRDRPSYTLELPGKWREMPPVSMGDVGALVGTPEGMDCIAVYGQPHARTSMAVMVFASRRKAKSRAAMQARCDAVRREHERFLRENASGMAVHDTEARYDEALNLYSLRTTMGRAEVDRFVFFTGQGEQYVVAFGPDSPLMSRVRQGVRNMSVGRDDSGFTIPELPFDLPGGVWPWLLIAGVVVFFWVGRRR